MRFEVRLAVAAIAILLGTSLTPTASNAADAVFAPCARLRHNSTIIKNAIDRINGNRRSAKDYRHIYESASKSIDKVQWPMTSGGTPGESTYTFQPADFDGDGKVDKAVSKCGSGEAQICFLTFDRGDGHHYELEEGFMYVERLSGHFYVAWDYTASPARVRNGGPSKDYAQYFAFTSRGFVEVCSGKSS